MQGLSVYIDTLLVCSCTGFCILLAGTYNVAADGTGAVLLVEQVPGIQYGISFMQEALRVSIGKTGSHVSGSNAVYLYFYYNVILLLSAGVYLQISVGRKQSSSYHRTYFVPDLLSVRNPY